MKMMFFAAAIMMVLAGCGRKKRGVVVEQTADTLRAHAVANSVYFWKTTFNLNDAERGFLKEHDIKRLYLHYFDVAMDNGWLGDQLAAVPIATLDFEHTPPDGLEIVPTVYITLDALVGMRGNESEFARKIAARVLAMSKRNKVENVAEVQLDCDWTKSTAANYFKLCRDVADTLHKRGIALSVTVRMHQLGGEMPDAADRGVLMLYNTGALQNAKTGNSILDAAEVAKYLPGRESSLPLDFAYPTFAWGVWFRGGKFQAIVRRTDFSDQTLYEAQRGGIFKVVKAHYLEGHQMCAGDTIRLENSDYDQIMRVKKMLPAGTHSNILYHLDSANLSKYTHDEIEDIYSRR